MSAHNDNTHAHAGHGHGAHGDAAPHATLRGYLTGFILSVILTAIPFWLVMTGALDSTKATGLVIAGLAAVQIVVHMVYFLHMSPKSESGWTMMALIFTAVIVFITLTGSIWVMYHLNDNMMPMMNHDTSQLP